MKKSIPKRILSVFLALLMFFTTFPVGAIQAFANVASGQITISNGKKYKVAWNYNYGKNENGKIRIPEYSDLVSQLFNFGYEAMDLIKPCLYNKKAFDMVNMISEVRYWVDVYKDRYSDEQLVIECCQSIVFNLFCIIDGVSSNNDFKIEKTVFDDTMQDAEFHRLWCEYLNKKQQGE